MVNINYKENFLQKEQLILAYVYWMPTKQVISNSVLQAIKGFMHTQNKNIFWNPVNAFWENTNFDKFGQKL